MNTSSSFFLLLLLHAAALHIKADDYKTTSPDNKSLLLAAGCFWCAEQAFEQYAPGVIEAVSGYAGANGIDNPTYRNHPGHYEVILIEYDPSKTTYRLLVEYAWRNLDPFDGAGQFCDRGSSYYPAIFYNGENERLMAEQVKEEILEVHHPEWDEISIEVPLLERPVFWTAEDYHQDYYIKKPRNYGYYKERCGRTKRLKSVWGEEEYYCYHDLEAGCFNSTVVNEDGDEVEAEVNVKDAPEETDAALLPTIGVVLVSIAGGLLGCMLLAYIYGKFMSRRKKEEADPH
ncbi:hypothetical protein ACHAXR_007496 [Thalassiosira sp. AJA248-18]